LGTPGWNSFIQHLLESGLLSAADISSYYESLHLKNNRKMPKPWLVNWFKAGKLTSIRRRGSFREGQRAGLREYRVLDKLGEGGMGVVLKAEHRRMKRVVAVKMIAGAALKSPDAVNRFYREVEAAARLNHSNIVTGPRRL